MITIARKFRLSRLCVNIIFYMITGVIVFYTVFPFYWAVISSLKSGNALFSTDLWPKQVSFDNYHSIFFQQHFGYNIFNSFIVAIVAVAIGMFVSVTASYALGRTEFRGRGFLLITILSASMFPQVAVLSGMFELIHALGLYNTYLGLILSYMIIVLPFSVWILTTFMRTVPKELEEAAIMDGVSTWIIITRIFLPLLKPVLFASGTLTFISAWNEFLFALTFTQTDNMHTVPVAIALMASNRQLELPWGNIMAASVTVTLPLIGLVFMFQKYIISGLTAEAVKS